jgi:hypothetical protein
VARAVGRTSVVADIVIDTSRWTIAELVASPRLQPLLLGATVAGVVRLEIGIASNTAVVKKWQLAEALRKVTCETVQIEADLRETRQIGKGWRQRPCKTVAVPIGLLQVRQIAKYVGKLTLQCTEIAI